MATNTTNKTTRKLQSIEKEDDFFKLEKLENRRGAVIHKFSASAKAVLMSWVNTNYFHGSKFVPPRDDYAKKGSYGWHILLATGKMKKSKEDQCLFYESVKQECHSIMSTLRTNFTKKFKKIYMSKCNGVYSIQLSIMKFT